MKQIIFKEATKNDYLPYVFGGVGLIGLFTILCISHKSYTNYLKLKQQRDLEYKKLNDDFNYVIKIYEENTLNKNIFLIEKQTLENIQKIDNYEEKFKNSLVLQNDAKFKIFYEKLHELKKNLDINNEQLVLEKNSINKYIIEYNKTLNETMFNEKLDSMLNLEVNYSKEFLKNNFIKEIKSEIELSALNLINRAKQDPSLTLDEIKSLIKYKTKLLKVCANNRISLDNTIQNFKNCQITHKFLLSEHSKIAQLFLNDANKLLQNKINFIENYIQDLDMQFKNLHISNSHLHKIKENLLEDKISKNILKESCWEENEINKAYLNSNHTYFWICYDEFWGNIKSKLCNSFNKSSNLKFIDSQNILNNNAFDIIYVNHDLNDLFFKLYIFNLKIFLISHIHYLKTIIPVCYLGVGLLVSYVLYKKLKFVYHCYKTKTLKVTFLNWLFDSEIVFTISKTGIFYCIAILGLLGLLYYLSGFGYWLAFIFCGRTLIWNWIKFGLYKLNKKYNWYKK